MELVDGAPVDVGGGGEGFVFAAHRQDDTKPRLVALKMHTALTGEDFARFAERARALSEIDQPHVMHLLDVFVGTALIDDEDPPDDAFNVMYTVAEWIPGLSLPAALEATTTAAGLRWVAQVARAAAALHRLRSPAAPDGVVHRDIKPSNVRITPDGEAVLIDFGIARPHRQGDHTEGAGTYQWKAPEVVGGPGEPGPASDAWGVGALAYWVLLAEPPRLVGAAAARELLTRAARGAGFPDPKGLSHHIATLLETHPEDRPDDLSAWADETEMRAAGRRPRHPGRVAAIAAVLLILAGGAAAAVSSGGGTAPSPSQSRRLAREAVRVVPHDIELGSLLSVAAYARAPTIQARHAIVDVEQQPLDAILHAAGSVTSVAYGDHGTLLASGDANGDVALWDVTTRRPVDRFHVPGGKITSLAFSPDGTRVAAGDVSGEVVTRGTARTSTLGGSHDVGRKVTSVAFSPDGTVVAIGTVSVGAGQGVDQGEVVLWNPVSRQSAETYVPLGVTATSIAFDPDGSSLLAIGAENGYIDLWYASSPANTQYRLNVPTITADVSTVSFSPDGRTLAAGLADGHVELWNAKDPLDHTNPEAILSVGARVDGVAFDPGDGTLAAVDSRGGGARWAISDNREIGSVAGHATVTSAAFGPDGSRLVTADGTQNIVLWTTVPKEGTLTPGDGGSWIDAASFNAPGGLLASADYNGGVDLWNLADDSEKAHLSAGTSQIFSVALDHDGVLLAAGDAADNVTEWNTLTGERSWVRDDQHLNYSVAFSPRGTVLAAGTSGAATVLLSAATGRTVGRLADPDESQVHSVAFSPDGAILATGDATGYVTLWRLSTDRQIGRFVVDTKHRIVNSVAFSPSGAVLAVGDDDGSASLWRVPSGTEIRRLDGHSRMLSVAFTADGRTLLAGASDGEVEAWDVRTGAPVGAPVREGGPVWGLAVDAGDGMLAIARDRPGLAFVPSRLVTESTSTLASRVCDQVRANLTPSQWATYVGGNAPYQKLCPAS